MDSNPHSISSVRTTKRKLDDALHILDGAVVSPLLAPVAEKPTPSKRPHLTRSVYSNLTKLGVTSKGRSRLSSSDAPTIDVAKSTPHLTAILARSVSKQIPTSKPISIYPFHLVSEYRPSSLDSFLSRLSTYKITTYANKPTQIDTVAAARCGWINDGKDRLVCGMCDVSWVLASREGMNKDAASTLVEKQRVSLVEMHKDGCPWKARQCDSSVYRVPLKTPTAMVHELRATALSLEPILANIAIRHPLNLSQVTSLHTIFSLAASERGVSEQDSIPDLNGTVDSIVPSDSAIIVALFGWVSMSITTNSQFHTPSLSISRARSYGPSISMPLTQSLSRTSSISSHLGESANIPITSCSPPRSISQFNASPDRMGGSSCVKNSRSGDITGALPRDFSLVCCVLCQRRVGLWGYSKSETTTTSVREEGSSSASFPPQKEFDLLKEHRSYCPYIVCSSVVPSFSRSPPDSLGNTIEGWRAVFTVVQRYELSQQQRLSHFMPRDDFVNQVPSTELKGVEAMVAGVKINGGQELLRYIKGLLG